MAWVRRGGGGWVTSPQFGLQEGLSCFLLKSRMPFPSLQINAVLLCHANKNQRINPHGGWLALSALMVSCSSSKTSVSLHSRWQQSEQEACSVAKAFIFSAGMTAALLIPKNHSPNQGSTMPASTHSSLRILLK